MSFAVIQTGGKQYKVRAGEILKIEKLVNSKADSKVEFKEVLAYGDDKIAEVGAPKIDGAKVEANIVRNGKNRTILVFKKRRRKNSRKKYGHRQPISLIRITKIFSKDGKIIAEAQPQKKITKEIVKGEKQREEQILKAKKEQNEKPIKKMQAKAKKVSDNIKKKEVKKKPLTTKKKW